MLIELPDGNFINPEAITAIRAIAANPEYNIKDRVVIEYNQSHHIIYLDTPEDAKCVRNDIIAIIRER